MSTFIERHGLVQYSDNRKWNPETRSFYLKYARKGPCELRICEQLIPLIIDDCLYNLARYKQHLAELGKSEGRRHLLYEVYVRSRDVSPHCGYGRHGRDCTCFDAQSPLFLDHQELYDHVSTLRDQTTEKLERLRSGQTALVHDHCHQHGWIRGVVCPRCNALLSQLDHDLRGYDPFVLGGRARMLDYVARCPDCDTENLRSLVRRGRPRPRTELARGLNVAYISR